MAVNCWSTAATPTINHVIQEPVSNKSGLASAPYQPQPSAGPTFPIKKVSVWGECQRTLLLSVPPELRPLPLGSEVTVDFGVGPGRKKYP